MMKRMIPPTLSLGGESESLTANDEPGGLSASSKSFRIFSFVFRFGGRFHFAIDLAKLVRRSRFFTFPGVTEVPNIKSNSCYGRRFPGGALMAHFGRNLVQIASAGRIPTDSFAMLNPLKDTASQPICDRCDTSHNAPLTLRLRTAAIVNRKRLVSAAKVIKSIKFKHIENLTQLMFSYFVNHIFVKYAKDVSAFTSRSRQTAHEERNILSNQRFKLVIKQSNRAPLLWYMTCDKSRNRSVMTEGRAASNGAFFHRRAWRHAAGLLRFSEQGVRRPVLNGAERGCLT